MLILSVGRMFLLKRKVHTVDMRDWKRSKDEIRIGVIVESDLLGFPDRSSRAEEESGRPSIFVWAIYFMLAYVNNLLCY